MTAVAALAVVNAGFSCPEPAELSILGGASGAPKKLTIDASYSGGLSFPPGGTFTPTGGGNFQITDRPVSGSFSASLGKKVTIPKSATAAGGGVKSVTGSLYGSVDGNYNVATGTGNSSGVMVMRFSVGKLGIACVTFAGTVSNRARTEEGSFTLVGGTKEAKTSRFSGTYSQTGTGVSPTASQGSGQLTGKVKFDKSPRGLTDECKALLPNLP
jgi:hypothetical protein